MTEAQITQIKKYAVENTGVTFYDKNGKEPHQRGFGDYRKWHQKLYDNMKSLWGKGLNYKSGIRG